MKKENRICITGIGVVSPIGIGKEEFLSSLKGGRSGIEEIKEFDTRTSLSKKAGRVRSFQPRDFIAASKLRRLDRASQFAIAASKLALADAQFSVTHQKTVQWSESFSARVSAGYPVRRSFTGGRF